MTQLETQGLAAKNAARVLAVAGTARKNEALHAIARALLERETISGEDIDILMRGESLPPFQMDGQNAGEFRLEDADDSSAESGAESAEKAEGPHDAPAAQDAPVDKGGAPGEEPRSEK